MKRTGKRNTQGSRKGIVVIGVLGVTIVGALAAVLVAMAPNGATNGSTYSHEGGLTKAKLAFMDGDLDAARVYAEGVSGHGPDAVDAKVLLARVALEERRFAEAEKILGEILKETPGEISALRVLAETYRFMGRSRQSIGVHRKIVEAAKDDARAWTDYGLAQIQGDDAMGALFSFRKSLSLDPDQPDIRDLMNQIGMSRNTRPGLSRGGQPGSIPGFGTPGLPRQPGMPGGGFDPRGGAGQNNGPPDPFRGTPLEGRGR